MSLPYGDRLYGRSITVINRSEVVGRPLAALLANDGATVYSVDVTGVQKFSRGEGIKKTRHEVMDQPEWELKDCLPLSDVVISGVPGETFKVPIDLLKEGTVCINFASEKVTTTRLLKLTESLLICVILEFLTRGERASIDLCTCYRESDHCCLASELAGTHIPCSNLESIRYSQEYRESSKTELKDKMTRPPLGPTALEWDHMCFSGIAKETFKIV